LQAADGSGGAGSCALARSAVEESWGNKSVKVATNASIVTGLLISASIGQSPLVIDDFSSY
jgi:hypothetical protein